MDKTINGRPFRTPNSIDEYTQESLALNVSRKLKSKNVLNYQTELFFTRGTPDHIRSDNSSEFTARHVRK